MATKIKGIYSKGFKYIAQIFVVKEREMEIGHPTDVKHVAHIGWDGGASAATAPSWMNDFKAPPEYSSITAMTNTKDKNSTISFSPWSSQDFDQYIGHQPSSSFSGNIPSSDLPKKQKRKKKNDSSSSPMSSSSSSSRYSSLVRAKAKQHEIESNHKHTALEMDSSTHI